MSCVFEVQQALGIDGGVQGMSAVKASPIAWRARSACEEQGGSFGEVDLACEATIDTVNNNSIPKVIAWMDQLAQSL